MNLQARTVWYATLLWASLGVSETSSATTMRQQQDCKSDTVEADVKIQACSAFIDSGRQINGTRLTDIARRAALSLRSIGYFKKSDFERSLADIDAAMRLSPNQTELYAMRGTVFLNLKQYDRASADFREAVRLKPNNEFAKKSLQSMELNRQMESRWERYLLEIQDDHDFANWPGPPLDIYKNANQTVPHAR